MTRTVTLLVSAFKVTVPASSSILPIEIASADSAGHMRVERWNVFAGSLTI
jgi:hypothetical protein